MWRSTGDIHDAWEFIRRLIREQDAILPYGGVGCFNDMDMLVVGMRGIGNVGKNAGCTPDEYRTHFSAWCLFASPLMIGCDVRQADPETLAILTNREAIAIDQDPACRQIYRIRTFWENDEVPVYARLLANGDYAIGAFNLTDGDAGIAFCLDEIGLPATCPKTLRMRNVWSGEEDPLENDTVRVNLKPHECRLWRCRVVER